MINSKIKNLEKRHKKEQRFKNLGIASISFALLFLVLLFGMIITKGSSAFTRTEMALEIDLTEVTDVEDVNYRRAIKSAIKSRFPEVTKFSERRLLYPMFSKIGKRELKQQLADNPELLGKKSLLWFSASSKVDMFFKYDDSTIVAEKQVLWIEDLSKSNQVRRVFNWQFFNSADSREPEIAGIAAALKGSLLVMLIFLGFAFPIGVMCAFYLEEFAPKSRITDIIEISINNLAAVPSIIYGLLGLTVYLQFMHLPRSSSIVGGMTLFMLVLPIIIISTRNTVRSIPNSIRDGAMALGASKMQVTIHHLLPLAIPGIMTGTILAISRALGETAPLLMIGMVAFIADIPQGFSDPTTVLPVQIYLWSDSPEMGFAEKTSAAIMVLLGFLMIFNLSAVLIRKKFERKW